MREECAHGGECLLRKVPLFNADNGGLDINIVQAAEFNREFAHQGDIVPSLYIDMGVSWYIRQFAVS
ncbi:MAG: hypothetical protein WBC29_02095 [Candidatus Moraniibacteriota bacterium]